MIVMRIAQLANFVSPTSGGMKVAMDALGEGYLAAGHERILLIPGPRDRIVEDDRGIVVEVGAPKVADQYRMIAAPWRAFALLDRLRPDSVEVSDKWTLAPAGRWARGKGVGSVLFSHERLGNMLGSFLRVGRVVRPVVRSMNRWLARNYDAIVVTSGYAAEEFDVQSIPTELVPLGVDLERFRPDRGRPLDDGVLRLIHAGRLSHEKHPQLAVATAVELHRRGVPVHMDLFGTGPDEAALRALAGDAPIAFRGFVGSRDDLARRFACADLAMSVCPEETFGLAVLEALACGTPVLTADRGGARELVDRDSGAWAAPDARSLADAVQALLPRLGPELRAGARRRAERYRWDTSVARMLEVHHRVAR